MRQQVHGQGGHGDVSFAASRTRFAPARLQITVRLTMSRQVGRRGVSFAALAANVAATAVGSPQVVVGPLSGRTPAGIGGRRRRRRRGRRRTGGAVGFGNGRSQQWVVRCLMSCGQFGRFSYHQDGGSSLLVPGNDGVVMTPSAAGASTQRR